MKKFIYFSFLLLATSLGVSLFNQYPAHALTGRSGWTMEGYTGPNKSPAISGSALSCINDGGVIVTLAKDESDIYLNRNLSVFRSSDGGVYYSTWSGDWSLNFADHGFGLENGSYTIKVQCSNPIAVPGGFTYYISDTFVDAVYIYPQSCDDTATDCVPIYRFYNTAEGSHFYTAVSNEKHQLAGMGYTYRYEGIAGFASAGAYDGGLAVHRFYNKKTGTHFYTGNQAEASRVNDTMYTTYRYEGIAFYADAEEHYDSTAMHRFYKFNQGVHFYTGVQSEATAVNSTMSNTYRYEGVPFYIIKNI